MNFRTQVKEICKRQNITQKELAEKLEISDISLNQSLRGEYPQLQTLERIAAALNVLITELFEQPKKDYFNCPECGAKIGINPKQEIMKEIAKSLV
ncbi:MAG: helix-turn-helix transcriptional regulator [Paludibacter sp.]|nr:helix-turn-helix transcriptional regulator [Paludibacter sp.]